METQYKIIKAKSASGKAGYRGGRTFYIVRKQGVFDSISHHGTEKAAQAAVKRYEAADHPVQ